MFADKVMSLSMAVYPTLHVFFQHVEIKDLEVFRLFEVVNLLLFRRNFRILFANEIKKWKSYR